MRLRVEARLPERGVDLVLSHDGPGSLGLIGPNGAGKSTVLGLLAGHVVPAEGIVAVDDEVLTEVRGGRVRTRVPPHARRLVHLSQDPLLLPHLSVLGNVRFGLRAAGTGRKEATRQARDLLERWGLAALADRRPHQLSGGQAQRVAIVRALAVRPRLLLLDEPLAALDVEAAPQVRTLLQEALASTRAVVVTHDALDAVTLCSALAVLEGGTIAEHGGAAAVLATPRSDFATRFAGLVRVSGVASDGGVVLADGTLLRARRASDGSVPPAPGEAVHAVVDPAAIRLLPPGADPAPGSTAITRRLEALEPHGDRARLRTADLGADLPALEAAAQGLAPGSTVRLAVPAAEVRMYPVVRPAGPGPRADTAG